MMPSVEKPGSLLDEGPDRRLWKVMTQKQRSWGRKEPVVVKRSRLEGHGGYCLHLNLTSRVFNC